MRKLLLLLALTGLTRFGRAQSAGAEALRRYQAATQALRTVSCDVQRIDTFGQRDVWSHTGHLVLQRSSQSKLLGVVFYLTQADAAASYCYNGNIGFSLDDKARTFELDGAPYAPSVLGSPAGPMLPPLLLGPEPGYQSPDYSQGVLHLRYPDDPPRDLYARQTWLTLDEATSLPRVIKTSVVRGGRRWVTIWRLSGLRLDAPADAAALAQYPFLGTYAPVAAPPPTPPVSTLLGKKAPAFERPGLAGGAVPLGRYRGRVVLLDFWAIWCSPCIAAMPEVQGLQDQFAGKLAVLGVLNSQNPATVREGLGIVRRRQVRYPNVAGDELLLAAYQVLGYPCYVVIGKDGRVADVLQGGGTTDKLRKDIRVALAK